jgi:ABC-type nitrate/sulfonate/bicarbonate transport system substrate-binding protein
MKARTFLAATLVLVLALAACGTDDDLEIVDETGEEPDTDVVEDDDDPAEDVGDEQPPDTPVNIRMGWGIPVEEQKYVMMAFPEVAPNLGTWYEVEWQQFAGTALGVQGLAAGTLDGATVGGQSVANGIAQGADIVITGTIIEEREICTTPYLVRKDDGIETPADMAGRVRGTSAIGGSTHYLGRVMLAEHGLEEEVDYDIVEVSFALGQEALETGQVDMMELASFFGIRALATDQFDVVFCVTDVQDPFVQLLQGFRRDFVEEHPEVIAKFVEDWETVTNWVLDPANRDQVIEATNQATEMPLELLDSFLLLEGQDYHRPRNGALDIDALQANWDFFHEIGEIPDLQVRDHVIPELLPAGS